MEHIRGLYEEERKGCYHKGYEGNKEEVGLVANEISLAVGYGRRVPFWKGKCSSMPLSIAFPTSYAIAGSKDTMVRDVWNMDEGEGCWSPICSRPFNG